MAEISTQNNKKVDNFNRTESDSYLQRILAPITYFQFDIFGIYMLWGI
jgi:hypothetical protein